MQRGGNTIDVGLIAIVQFKPPFISRTTPEEKAFMSAYEAKRTPAAQRTWATTTRANILKANPKADVSKLNSFLGAK